MFTFNVYQSADTSEIKKIMADAVQQLTDAFAELRNASQAEQQEVAGAIATLVQKVDELTEKVNAGVPIESVLAELNQAKADVQNIYNAPTAPEPSPEPVPAPPVDETPVEPPPAPVEEPPVVEPTPVPTEEPPAV